MLDRVVAHSPPRASTVRWNFHICAVNTVFEHKGDIIHCFETIRGVWAYHCAGSWRVCEAIGGFFLKLFHSIMDILFSQLQKQTIDSVFVWGNHTGIHTVFSDFSVHYVIPAGAAHQIIKEQLPHRKVLQAPTAACPNTRGLRGPVHHCLQL